MDTATVLRKGIYASIHEFRNNQPSVFNYQVEPDVNGLLQLYLKDAAGQLYFSRKMWGYCDGQQCYVMMNGNLFPIIPVHHAFYVWGSKGFRLKNSAVPYLVTLPTVVFYGAATVSITAVRQLHFFNLDVYSGDIY